jgi:pimeloyl-ACP methyl ester carboxylesterase
VARRALSAALFALACAGCGGHGTAATERHVHKAVRTRTVPGEPGRQYLVNGRFLYLVCGGHGSPAVVLESGLGGDHRGWTSVEPQLARTTRLCTYDRSGLGFSQVARKLPTARQKVRDLHALLTAANVRRPYVLVGHSYGGMLVRVYAAAHPRDVAGIVLLDASHPDQTRRLRAALPPRRPREPQTLRELRSAFADDFRNPEGVDWKKSSDETRATGSLGRTPLVVVTAGQNEWSPSPAIAKPLRRTWLRLQDELAQLSTNSVHVVAVYSNHFVMSNLGQPDLVVAAVRAVVDAVRTHTRLPACRALFHGPGAKCVS